MLNEAKATFFGKITKAEKGGDAKPYMRLTMPINRSWQDGDERREKTSWIECVVFRPKLIELFEKLDVEGRYARIIADITVETRDLDGKKITATSFIVDKLDLLDPKPE
jgi:single-stranded DNA-binding protein